MTSDLEGLEPGERLIWSGAPNPLTYAWRKSSSNVFVGVLFLGILLLWAHQGGKEIAFDSLIFWVFGASVMAQIVLSPLWHGLHGLRASYALTDRRAVIAFSSPFTQQISIPLTKVGFVDVRLSPGGSGDIYLKEAAVPDGEFTKIQREGFVAIGEVAKVEQLLRAAVEKATVPGASR
jgi:hypothetical protein